jgi:hypothetical protein
MNIYIFDGLSFATMKVYIIGGDGTQRGAAVIHEAGVPLLDFLGRYAL